MPNVGLSGFWQTLVVETVKACELLAPSWVLPSAIYWDYSPIASTIGKTLQVVIPQDPTANVAEWGVGDLTISDMTYNAPVSIDFDQHPGISFLVRDFEQFNTPLSIRGNYIDPALKAIKNYLTAKVASLLVVGNFKTNLWDSTNHVWNPATGGVIYPCIGGGGKCLSVGEFVGSIANSGGFLPRMQELRIPTNDPANMSLLLPPKPYSRLLDSTTLPATGGPFPWDPSWSMSFSASEAVTHAARVDGVFPTAFGMSVRMDQQMPTSGSPGTRTFTGAYLHRWAIAGVSRPLPTPQASSVLTEFVNFTPNPDYTPTGPGTIKLPIRIMLSYEHVKMGHLISIDCGFGLKVVRESMCLPFVIAE